MTVRKAVLSATLGALVLVIAACSDDGASGSSAGSSTTRPAVGSTGALVTPPPRFPTGTSVPGNAEAAERKLSGKVLEVGPNIAAATTAGTDPSELSSPLLHVRTDGNVELVIRATGAIGPEQQADLQRLGVEVTRNQTNLVQAWVPHEVILDVAALPWVASLSPPSYASVGD